MKLAVTRSLLLALSLLLGISVCKAGPLSTDPAAFLRGTTHFLNTSNGVTLNVLADYAVYAPGAYSTSTALGNPTDPSAGARFVFAYEVFSQGTAGLSSLSVGLNAAALVANMGHQAANLTGSTAPSLSQLVGGPPPQSAKWSFIPSLPNGAHSDVLLFTSPYAPTFIQASTIGGQSTGDQQALPTPIPEPTTFVLAAVGLVGLHLARFRHKRNLAIPRPL